MAESEEALQLKRRARRRLVAPVALVTFVVIILLILDKEPGSPPAAQRTDRIRSRLVSTPALCRPHLCRRAGAREDNRNPAVKPNVTGEGSRPVSSRASAGGRHQVAAQLAQDRRGGCRLRSMSILGGNARSQCKRKTVARQTFCRRGKSYTEPVKTSKGELTRVRAGPCGKEAAENARKAGRVGVEAWRSREQMTWLIAVIAIVGLSVLLAAIRGVVKLRRWQGGWRLWFCRACLRRSWRSGCPRLCRRC